MKRFILLIISSFAVLLATAQEEIILDSIATKHTVVGARQPVILRPQLSNETNFTDEIEKIDLSIFHQPLLPDYNKNLNFKNYFSSSKATNYTFNYYGSSFYPISPFIQIFNQSSFQLNDRIILGGNSFGAQSVFDKQKMNPAIQDMSIKGASFFLQYKVNDNFKIQTRVSVSNHNSYPNIP